MTKNQHYVPQFILNGFDTAKNKTPRINIFDIQRNEFRLEQSTKEVFSQNYFYDKNNKIENFLDKHIETPASILIGKLKGFDLSVLNSSNICLIKFICCQLYRTVEARQDTLTFINSHIEKIISDLSRFNNIEIENPKDFRIVPDGEDALRNFTAATALTGCIDSKAMEDLKFHLLVNKTNREFIISDHPIIRYNWLYKDLKDPRIGSLAAKGVQLFIPLTKHIYLCAYDSKSYKYGGKKSNLSELVSLSDVDFLNEMQVRGATSFIGYSSRKLENYIKNMAQKHIGKKIYSYETQFLYEENLEDGKIKTGHMVYTTQKKLSKLPSFIKVLKKAKERSTQFQERDPELSRALLSFKEQSLFLDNTLET